MKETTITYGGFIHENIVNWLREEAKSSGDPLNWLNALEDALEEVVAEFEDEELDEMNIWEEEEEDQAVEYLGWEEDNPE
jgi:hypothetical protein